MGTVGHDCPECGGETVYCKIRWSDGQEHIVRYCETCRQTLQGLVSRQWLIECGIPTHDFPVLHGYRQLNKLNNGKKKLQVKWVRECNAKEKIERLRKMPYQEYLKTPHWREMRKIALERAHFKCQICSNPGTLSVHHRTYERRGCELPSDLTVLCRLCHDLFHDKFPTPK